MKSMPTILASLVVACLGSVANASVPVQEALKVAVSSPIVASGGEVTVTITNVSGERWFVGGCLFPTVASGSCNGPVVRNFICSLVKQSIEPGDSLDQSWDLIDNKGNPVEVGEYHMPIEVSTYSDRKATLCARTKVVLTGSEPSAGLSGPGVGPIGGGEECGVTFYGSIGHGSGYVGPELWALDVPEVGNDQFGLHIQGGLGGAPAFVLLGLGSAQHRSSIGVLAVDLAKPHVVLPIQLHGEPNVPGAGVLNLEMPIPNEARLGGLTFHGQVLVADPHASGNYAHSAGMTVTICD